MPNKINQLLLVVVIGSLWLITACAAEPAPPPTVAVKAQAVAPANTATPTPAPTSTLPTEIIEEPVSPVAADAMPMPDKMPNMPPNSETALKAALADLAKQTGLPASDIAVLSVEAVEWSDSSLGCPQEGFMYAQVITPGYLIMLSGQGQTYEYHTDQGQNVVLCQK